MLGAMTWLGFPPLFCFFALSYLLYPLLSVIDVIFISLPVGFMLSGWVTYIASCLLGEVSSSSAYHAMLLLALLTLPFLKPVLRLYYMRRRLWQGELKHCYTLFWIILLNTLLSLYLFYYHYMHEEQNGTWMSGGTSWGDLPLHIGLIESFTNGVNKDIHGFLPIPKSPVFAGENLPIPFFPHIHRATLVLTGMTMRESFLIPNLILANSFVALLYQFYQQFFHRKSYLSFISIIFGVLSGGLGFLFWILGYGMNIHVNIDLDFLERWRIDELYPLPWNGVYGHLLMPQLDTIYAFPVVIAIWILMYRAMDKSLPLAGVLWIMGTAGVISFMLSMYHTHAFASIIFLAAALFAVSPRDSFDPAFQTKWIVFGIPALIGVPISVYFFGQLALVGEAKISFHFFWNQFTVTQFLFSNYPTIIQPILFWLLALGGFIPLSLYGMQFLEQQQFRFFVAAWVLFLVPNVVCMQVFHSQNLKMLIIWVFTACPAVAMGIHVLWMKWNSKLLRILLVILCCSLIFSGCLGIRRDIKQYAVLYTQEDVDAGLWIAENTNPHSVFLTSESHSSAVHMLAGRTVFASFDGWLIYHDYPGYEERLKNQQKILFGDAEIRPQTFIRKNNISYVVIDPELFETRAVDFSYWDKYPLLYSSEKYRIYNAKPNKSRKRS